MVVVKVIAAILLGAFFLYCIAIFILFIAGGIIELLKRLSGLFIPFSGKS